MYNDKEGCVIIVVLGIVVCIFVFIYFMIHYIDASVFVRPKFIDNEILLEKIKLLKGEKMNYYCKKCGSNLLHIEAKENKIGGYFVRLYCDKCGAWQKWLNKNDLKTFQYNSKQDSVDNKEKQNNNNCDILEKRFNSFIEYLNKLIDNEMGRLPISAEDAIRKNAYCLGLERCKNSIINILNGKEYYEKD